MKSRSFILFLIFFGIFYQSAHSQVNISEEKWVLPTYPVYPPDKNPMFFKGESYQGASKVIYPYGLNDMIANEKTDHPWKALILENEYIKLCVTPEIGGKLYYATDKTNGYNFIYKNSVVKPSNIGMTGAWVSGAIEWCVLHHHRASTFLPVDYEITGNDDGSKTIRIGETEPRQRMRWTIGITVFPGKSFFQAEVKIHNPTPFTHSFLYWANVAAHTNKDYQVIFPPSVDVVTYHAKNSFSHWPWSTEVYNGEDYTAGNDISWWKNSVNQNSYFAFDLKEDFMGGYDHGKQTGTVHIGDHHVVKGAKLWEWGSGERGQATEAKLTENDGPYVEIMVGAFSDNQPDYSWIQPYEVKTFKQYWYPVKAIGGFKNANLNGAVNFEPAPDGKMFMGFYATRKINRARIFLKYKDAVIYEKVTEISPEMPFTTHVDVEKNYDLTKFFAGLSDAESGETLISYQPEPERPRGGLPEVVKKPALPEEIKTIEELYLTGNRILQFYNPTLNATDYFREALNRDPGDVRTNIAMGNICLKNWEYAEARHYFSTAIKRLTRDYTRPSDCEALYLQGITLKALGRYEEAEDTLYRATWDHAWHSAAYLELARISCLKGDFPKALDQIKESLATNNRNNSALNLNVSVLRRLAMYDEARAVLCHADNDPLDFRAGNEKVLLANQKGDAADLMDLNRKMRDDEQNYLELAIDYLNDGFTDEARDVLSRLSGESPMINYYLGYIQDGKGNREEASRCFRKASSLSIESVFPFRAEDEKVLKLAAAYLPHDPKPYYYLGNLLYDKQPGNAIISWEKAVKLDPSLAILWRNLGWGYYYHQHDISKAIEAYERALALKKDDPVYYAEIDPLYEKNNAPVEKRAKLFDSVNDVVKKRDDAFVRQILVLNLAGEWEKAVKYLGTGTFHFREGSSRVRDITADARLLLGRKYLGEKKYREALNQFIAAGGSEAGPKPKSADERSPQINYFIGLAYEALGKKPEARAHFTLSADQPGGIRNYMAYYQGLSLLKIGKRAEASSCFNGLVDEGRQRIGKESEVDFFAKFGEKEAMNVQLSNGYLQAGLGFKGQGDKAKAVEYLKKALDLSASNLWAQAELDF